MHYPLRRITVGLSWGAMSAYPYIDHLLNTADILCLQEHHLIPETKKNLQSINTHFNANVKICAENDMYDSTGNRVRKAGVAILWRKNIGHMVSDIDIHGEFNDRIIGICVKNKKSIPLYIINLYMPSTNVTVQCYMQLINAVQVLYDTYCSRGVVIILGDYNAQIGPAWGPRAGIRQSDRGKVLGDFMAYNLLFSTITGKECQGPVCTYYPEDVNKNPSQIDHVLIGNEYKYMINNCKVYGDETLNASDHVPINVNISYNITRYEQCSRK